MHTGIGPFDINSGSLMSYGRVTFGRKGLRVSAFTQMLDGDADNLLTRDPAGNPIAFAFNTKTTDVDIANVQTLAKRHVVSYGGNLRYNKFDLSLAPNGDNRTELGLYAQDEIFLSDHFRLTAGGRVDRFDYLDSFVFLAAGRAAHQAGAESHLPCLVQSGLSVTIGHQQFSRHHDRGTADARAHAGVCAAGALDREPGPDGGIDERLRGWLHRHPAGSAAS